MPKQDSRTVRNLLNQVLLTDADLDAFIIDHFPAIKRRIAAEMNRISKVNLLFECTDIDKIAECLYRDYPILFPATVPPGSPADEAGPLRRPPVTRRPALRITRTAPPGWMCPD